MKFTLSWLKDHLETDVTPDAIANRLTVIGLEVEKLENPGSRLAGFTVARIIEASPHPNADKLQICKVDTGKGIVQVVCGAFNAHADLIGVFASPGTYIPGSNFTLAKTVIRGIESVGMLCSERELELSSEHNGIIELPSALIDRVGERYVDVMELNDPIIEVAVTPNRPDCLGVRGIARDLAAAGLGKLKKADDGFVGESAFKCPIAVDLRFTNLEIMPCSIFAGRVITGAKVGNSPDWMQRRLRAVGLRPINAAVDITNYISYDRARPLHVYDTIHIRSPIIARLGQEGENFRGLDGKDHKLDETMCVIADAKGVLGLAGIMGGETSRVTENTTAIFIESAYFDPARIAATGRKTGINSDARYRFERGIDPKSIMTGLNLATKMILNSCGGSASTIVVAGREPRRKTLIGFDPARVQKLSGAKYSNTEIIRSLKRLGFEVEGQAPEVTVTAPSWRPDIFGPADLVEEVVRLSGVDRVPSTPLPIDGVHARGVAETLTQQRIGVVRRTLAGRGMVETITWSFITSELSQMFGGGVPQLKLSNPISSELTDMRPGLLPGLIIAARANNHRGFNDVALFEVGQIFRGTRPEQQAIVAGGLRTGGAQMYGSGRHWDGVARSVDVFVAKADVLSILDALGVDTDKVQITRNAPLWYHPGRCGSIKLGPKTILAYFGELHPETVRALEIGGATAASEVFLDALPMQRKKGTAKGPLTASDFQAVERDFAFLIDRSTDAALVLKAVEGVDKMLITRVNVFDIFEGQGVPQGKKSIAIGITLSPHDRTLTEAEIDAVSAKIVANVKKLCAGELRG